MWFMLSYYGSLAELVSLCTPVPAVEVAVTNCFAYMLELNVGAAFKVGDCAGYFDYLEIATGGEVERRSGGIQELFDGW